MERVVEEVRVETRPERGELALLRQEPRLARGQLAGPGPPLRAHGIRAPGDDEVEPAPHQEVPQKHRDGGDASAPAARPVTTSGQASTLA